MLVGKEMSSHKYFLFFICCKFIFGVNAVSFNYEKTYGHLNAAAEANSNVGKENKLPKFRRSFIMNYKEHPGTLPTEKPAFFNPGPFESLYQGKRRHGDRAIVREKFDYPAILDFGQRVLFQDNVDCEISYIEVHADGGIPIILRGGVGYNHFTIIARTTPDKKLQGHVTIYCKGTPKSAEVVKPPSNPVPARRSEPVADSDSD